LYHTDLLNAVAEFSDKIRALAELASRYLETDCTVQNVAMDGNCLFTSLALQLGRSVDASHEVRSEVVDYISTNPQTVSLF